MLLDFLSACCNGISIPILVLLVFLTWWFLGNSRESGKVGRPLPGPRGVPILGYMPFLGPRLFVSITGLRKDYGDVFEVPIGQQRFVFFNSFESIKEAMVNQADRFSGRFKFELVTRSNRDSGLLFTDGAVWQEHRRFALRVLKDFGLGRPLSEDIVVHEAEMLRGQLEATAGAPQNTKEIFSKSVSNVVSRLSFGDRSGHEDPHFTQFMEKIDLMVAAGGFASLLPIIFPVINRHAWLFTPVEWFLNVVAHTEWCHDFVKRKIVDHKQRIDDMGLVGSLDQAQDYCDALLLEKLRFESEGVPHTFTEWQLIRNLFELFVAGTDTTSVTLCWACVLLSLHEEVQNAIHEELDEIVGSERSPTMADRRQCHYVNAVIDEILRVSSLAPFAIPHRSTEEAVVGGFFIPKDRIIMPNLYAVHHDPDLWGDPQNFRPERFLNEEGQYKTSEYMIAFGLGKRACLGESLARIELFIFFTYLMQRFKVRLHEPEKLDQERLLLGEDGTVRHLRPHQVIFELRQGDGH